MTSSMRRFQTVTAITIVVLDQVVKMIVRGRLPYGDSVQVIPGFFDLTRVHNTGAAFGMLDPVDFPYKAIVMPMVAAAALVGIAIYAATLDAAQRLSRIGLTFVVAGAAGNLIDRVVFGYVLDFVDVYWRGWHFWAFNVADASITAGVGLMILDLFGAGRHRAPRAV